jgi:hypothetical protein
MRLQEIHNYEWESNAYKSYDQGALVDHFGKLKKKIEMDHSIILHTEIPPETEEDKQKRRSMMMNREVKLKYNLSKNKSRNN